MSFGGGGGGSSSTGGDTTAADLAKAEEARKAEQRAKVNAIFDTDYSADDARVAGAVRGRYTDELGQTYGDAERNLKFNLARSGNVGSSTQADQYANLQREHELGGLRVNDAVENALADLRANRETNRGRSLQLVDSGSGDAAIQSGEAAIKSGIDFAQSQNRQRLFDDLFTDAAFLKTAADNTARGQNAAALYGNLRNSGLRAPSTPGSGPTIIKTS